MAGEQESDGGASAGGLLGPDDSPPFAVINPKGASPFLLIGDHAGNRIPAALGRLGLGEHDLERHIAWDIGVAGLGEALAARLDAMFVRQTYSRLVIDCNRDPAARDAMPDVSDGSAVPGNAGLTEEGRSARIAAICVPYQQAIAQEIQERTSAGRACILISLHSFTPVMNGEARPWHAGVLHDGANDAFALRLLACLEQDSALVVGDNQPYQMDGIDYTVPFHAFAAGLPYAELEIRQDLLSNAADIEGWAERLAACLLAASMEYETTPSRSP